MIRTRFAPSPTGFLHVGVARTALFSWLYARKHQGQFILRIEDTDLERSTQEAVQSILDGMHWLGLTEDEGPYYQTQHFERYQAVLKQLLNENKAYRCYCSKARLEALRTEQLEKKQKPRYDGHCRHQNKNSAEPYVIRFRNPETGEVVVDDQVRGRVIFDNQELDDLIIARSDGTPTYNFTVVVDDMDMRVTHVIRGDDHLNNTPRQINIFSALNAPIPVYAHLPMILGSDGQKLSKRHGAVSVMQYRDEGFLPDALLNYLIRLGWSHGDQEIFSREEMIELFDISDINHAAAAFNYEKLLWLNQHYIKTSDPIKVAEQLEFHMSHCDLSKGPALIEVVKVQRERAKTLCEMAEKSRFFYEALEEVPAAFYTLIEDAAVLSALKKLVQLLSELQEWSDESLHAVLEKTASECDLKLGKFAQPLRIALTGGTISPPMNSTLRLLGKENTLTRLSRALNHDR